MADITINPQTVSNAGVTPIRQGSLSASNRYFIPNNGGLIVLLQKSGAGACVVTIETPYAVDGLAVADRTVNVPASTGDVVLAGFAPSIYNQPGTNTIVMSFSETTGLTIAALQIAFP